MFRPVLYTGDAQRAASSATNLMDNLTATEKKILLKLKETARTKINVKPVSTLQGGLKLARKVYV